jgi:hypothetical protein
MELTANKIWLNISFALLIEMERIKVYLVDISLFNKVQIYFVSKKFIWGMWPSLVTLKIFANETSTHTSKW